MKRLLVKTNRRYIVATLDNPTLYVCKNIFTSNPNNQYILSPDVSKAMKSMNKNIALDLLLQYKTLSGDQISELIVLPIDISYELINECSEEI